MKKVSDTTRLFFVIACLKTGFLLIYGSLNPEVAASVDKLMMWNIMFDMIVGGKVTAEKFLKMKFGATNENGNVSQSIQPFTQNDSKGK